MIGQTLSHFKITAKLGEGGMGEVYRAEDTKLGREVAIKVLPEAVAADPERRARFEREAKVLASLNHTHIAAIYQVEQDGESLFLVMELVEGEDLKERLARGPMELDDALSAGFQVAEALETAHEKGIVHRDLKPANVKVTPEGQVKVLDFGLAKALDASTDSASGSGSLDLSMSPTLTAQMTGAGVILGTAAYMSPEQARGKPVDRRADVWAFGVLLWEMLTATTLFEGETVTDVIASVVTKDPDLEVLPAATPPEVERLLARCLRKDPSRRLPDIGAARVVLQDVLTGTTPEARVPTIAADGVTGGEPGRPTRKRWLWATGALVAAGVAAVAAFVGLTEEPRRPQTVRFAMSAPDDWNLSHVWDWPVPSPTGDRVVFRASRDSSGGGTESTLWIRSLESPIALPLGGTEGIGSSGPIAWSPDGGSLLFRVGEEIRALDLANGTTRALSKLVPNQVSNASWNDSGTIIFSAGGGQSLIYSVPASGGEVKQLTTWDTSQGEVSHHFPQFLPDSNRYLFFAFNEQPERSGLYLASLDEPDMHRKVAEGLARRQYASGHLLFVQGGTLLAQPFDTKKAMLTGSPVAIGASVASWAPYPDIGSFGVSSGGTIAYLTGSSSSIQLTWVDRRGEVFETVGEPADYGQIALSPDGRNVALEIRDDEGQFDLWVMDVARGVTSRVTATPEDERDPVWSPDGRSLAYIKRGNESASLSRKGLRTTDPEMVLMESTDEYIPESWSADGKTIITVQRTPDDQQSIWALTEGDDPRPFLTPGFRVDEPQVSPDGNWLAYVSPESEQPEVYLEPFQGEGERVRVSLNGGGQPKWRADSQELFFVTPADLLMAVDVRGDTGRAEVSLPRELFEVDWIEGSGYDDYAVSADGERFLVKTAADQAEIELRIVTNWTGLLD